MRWCKGGAAGGGDHTSAGVACAGGSRKGSYRPVLVLYACARLPTCELPPPSSSCTAAVNAPQNC